VSQLGVKIKALNNRIIMYVRVEPVEGVAANATQVPPGHVALFYGLDNSSPTYLFLAKSTIAHSFSLEFTGVRSGTHSVKAGLSQDSEVTQLRTFCVKTK
jgi:hypothetical protein